MSYILKNRTNLLFLVERFFILEKEPSLVEMSKKVYIEVVSYVINLIVPKRLAI